MLVGGRFVASIEDGEGHNVRSITQLDASSADEFDADPNARGYATNHQVMVGFILRPGSVLVLTVIPIGFLLVAALTLCTFLRRAGVGQVIVHDHSSVIAYDGR